MEDEKIAHGAIRTVELPLCFAIDLSPTELTVRAEGGGKPAPGQPGRALRALGWARGATCTARRPRVCRLLCQEGRQFRYPARQAEETLATLLPALSAVGTVVPSPELAQRLETAPLKAAAYLDLVGGNVEARVEFTMATPSSTPSPPPVGKRSPRRRAAACCCGMAVPKARCWTSFSDAGFVVRGGTHRAQAIQGDSAILHPGRGGAGQAVRGPMPPTGV